MSKPAEQKPDEKAPDAPPEAANQAAAKKSKKRAPGPVPSGEIPMCWVSDDDTPEPYLINESEFNADKHTRCT